MTRDQEARCEAIARAGRVFYIDIKGRTSDFITTTVNRTSACPELHHRGFYAFAQHHFRAFGGIGRPRYHACFVFVHKQDVQVLQTWPEYFHPLSRWVPVGIERCCETCRLRASQSLCSVMAHIRKHEQACRVIVRHPRAKLARELYWIFKGQRTYSRPVQELPVTIALYQHDSCWSG